MANNKKTVSADASNPFSTLVNLWPYMWPKDRRDLKLRVVWATIFLVVSKFVLLLVPYFFKWATDALNGKLDMAGLLPAFLLGAVALVILYNLTRIAQVGLNQLRDASVCQRRPICRAPARFQDLRAHSPPVAAIPP